MLGNASLQMPRTNVRLVSCWFSKNDDQIWILVIVETLVHRKSSATTYGSVASTSYPPMSLGYWTHLTGGGEGGGGLVMISGVVSTKEKSRLRRTGVPRDFGSTNSRQSPTAVPTAFRCPKTASSDRKSAV